MPERRVRRLDDVVGELIAPLLHAQARPGGWRLASWDVEQGICVTLARMFETISAFGSSQSSNTISSVATPLLISHTTSRGVIVAAFAWWFTVFWSESRMLALCV